MYFEQRVELLSKLSVAGFELKVHGSCMMPDLEDGQIVHIQKQEIMIPGDIIAVHDLCKRILVHRFIGVRPSSSGMLLVTKADDTQIFDRAVPYNAYLGHVSCRISKLQRLKSCKNYITGHSRILRRFVLQKMGKL